MVYDGTCLHNGGWEEKETCMMIDKHTCIYAYIMEHVKEKKTYMMIDKHTCIHVYIMERGKEKETYMMIDKHTCIYDYIRSVERKRKHTW